MCSGIPGKLIETHEKNGLHLAKVDFGGIARKVFPDYLPEAQAGQYCSIHVGFEVSILNDGKTLETLDLLKQIGSIEEEFEESG